VSKLSAVGQLTQPFIFRRSVNKQYFNPRTSGI